jgi:hypothetical protein
MFQMAARDGITSMLVIAIIYMIHACKRGDNLMPKLRDFKNSKFLISWFVLQFFTYIIGTAASPYVAIILGCVFVVGVLMWRFLPKTFRPLDSSMNHYLHIYPQAYSQSWFTFEGQHMLAETKWRKLGRDALYIATLMSFVSWIFALKYTPIRVAIMPKIGVGFKYVFVVAIVIVWIFFIIGMAAAMVSGNCTMCTFPDLSGMLDAVAKTNWKNSSASSPSMILTIIFTIISGIGYIYSQIIYPIVKAKLPVLTFQRFFMTGAFSFMVYHASPTLMSIMFYGYLIPIGIFASYVMAWLGSFDFFCGCCFCGCGKSDPEHACEPFACVPCGFSPCAIMKYFNNRLAQQVENAENNLN